MLLKHKAPCKCAQEDFFRGWCLWVSRKTVALEELSQAHGAHGTWDLLASLGAEEVLKTPRQITQHNQVCCHGSGMLSPSASVTGMTQTVGLEALGCCEITGISRSFGQSPPYKAMEDTGLPQAEWCVRTDAKEKKKASAFVLCGKVESRWSRLCWGCCQDTH